MREANLTSIPLLPAPTKICLIERRLLNLTGVSQISVAQELGSTVVREAGRLLNEFRCKSGLHVHVVSAGKPRAESEESYSLRLESGHALLDPGGPLGAIWGLATLRQLLQTGKSPSVEIIDAPAFKFRAVQIDLARQIERPERVCDLIDLYASHKFNILVLYLEGAYRYRNHPSVSRQFAWTYDKARRVVEHASSRGMKVIPVIPSLGHADYITRAKNYRNLDESRDAARSGCLCPSQPRTYQVLSEMYSDWKDLATSGILHVGLDESWAIGKCPLCASRRAKNIGEGGIFVEHANRLAGLARSLGLRPAIWGDMFYYYPEALKNLRRDILIFDWYYYPFERFPKIEVFNFREIDSLALWAKHGLQAWGCAASIWDGAGIPTPRPSERLKNIRS